MTIPLVHPSDSASIPLDWSDVLGDSLTLSSVTHTLPAGLTKVSESTDTANGLSQVTVSGATHGQLYHIQAAATLSDGQVVTRVIPARAFNA